MADSGRCGERIRWVWRIVGHQLSTWTPSYIGRCIVFGLKREIFQFLINGDELRTILKFVLLFRR
jgi:hypothetical protein